jgi:lipoate synthase
MTHTAGFVTRSYRRRVTAKNVALVSDLCIQNAFLLHALVNHRWSLINGNVLNVRRLFTKCRKTRPLHKWLRNNLFVMNLAQEVEEHKSSLMSCLDI